MPLQLHPVQEIAEPEEEEGSQDMIIPEEAEELQEVNPEEAKEPQKVIPEEAQEPLEAGCDAV